MSRPATPTGSPVAQPRSKLLELRGGTKESSYDSEGLRQRRPQLPLTGGSEAVSVDRSLEYSAENSVWAPSVLHPLTKKERRALQSQIQSEVTVCAIAMLSEEKDLHDRLNGVHVKCISLLVLASAAIGGCLIYLRSVLVPFVLAVFLMFLMEPILFGLLNPPLAVQKTFPKLCRSLSMRINAARREAQASTHRPGCTNTTGSLVQRFLVKAWTALSIILTLLLLFSVIGWMVFFCIKAIENFPWEKYKKSPKVMMVLQWFPHFGTDPEDFKVASGMAWLINGPFFDVLDLSLSFISGAFLTFLFLAFLLLWDSDNADNNVDGLAPKIRRSVQRYVRVKSLMSMLVTVTTGFLYIIMKVDLWLLFSLLTFVLYFIPHVGNTIAILAPLALAFLDPGKSAVDLVIIFSVPFMVHQLATNMVDPKLLAHQLDLHPITVLLSLAFWTVVWGPIGAVLSVPLTATVRLGLIELDHPYTAPIVNILKGELRDITESPKRKKSKTVVDASEEYSEGMASPARHDSNESLGSPRFAFEEPTTLTPPRVPAAEQEVTAEQPKRSLYKL